MGSWLTGNRTPDISVADKPPSTIMKPIRLILLAFLGISLVCWPGLSGHAASPHVIKRGQMHMGTLVFLTAVASGRTTGPRCH